MRSFCRHAWCGLGDYSPNRTPPVFPSFQCCWVLSRLVVRTFGPIGCWHLRERSGSSRECVVLLPPEKRLSDQLLRQSAKQDGRETGEFAISLRQTHTFATLQQGQRVAHKLKGISHPHVVPNGEGVAVERIAAPLVGFEAFPFKAFAMPMPSLLVVAAP